MFLLFLSGLEAVPQGNDPVEHPGVPPPKFKRLGGVAAAQLAESLTEAGSTANVDVVAGSTFTSQAVLAGMDDCLAQAAAG